MVRISKRFTFEAAHRLQHHNGKCRNLHGHGYKVEAVIEGPLQENHPLVQGVDEDPLGVHNPSEGMVLDFGLLKKWWTNLEYELDHVTILEVGDPLIAALNSAGKEGTSITLMPFPPTAENIAGWILQDLQDWLVARVWPEGFVTPKVRVWETESSWAEA